MCIVYSVQCTVKAQSCELVVHLVLVWNFTIYAISKLHKKKLNSDLLTCALPSNAAMSRGDIPSLSDWFGFAPLSMRRVTSFAALSDSQVTATDRAVLPSWRIQNSSTWINAIWDILQIKFLSERSSFNGIGGCIKNFTLPI